MPIGPFHHRSDTKAPVQRFLVFLLIFSHFLTFVRSSCRTILGSFGPVLPSALRQCRTFKAVSYHGNDNWTDSQRRLKGFYRTRTSLVVSLYENQDTMSCWHDDHGLFVKHLENHAAAKTPSDIEKSLSLDRTASPLGSHTKPVACLQY